MAITDFSDQAVQEMTLEEADDNARVWNLVFGQLEGKSIKAWAAAGRWERLVKAIKAETEAIEKLKKTKYAARAITAANMTGDSLKTSGSAVSQAEEKVVEATANKMQAIESAKKTEEDWEQFRVGCNEVRLEDPTWKSKSDWWGATSPHD